MAEEKWSAFPNGGTMVTGDQLVGLRSGANTRLTPVIPAQVQQSAFNFAALGGSSNAFTVTLTPAVATLTDGMIVTFYSGSKFNTIAAPTLSVNGLTPVTIVCWSGGLAPNDITTATEYLCIYNLADNVFQLTNPSISTANTFEVQANGYNYALDTGVANAYIANILPAQISSILSGFEVIMSAINANTGASTLTVNGVTHPILLSNGAALTGGEIIVNGTYQFIYSSALAAFVLINSSFAASSSSSATSITATGGTTTLTSISAQTQIVNGSNYQIIKMPNTSTLSIGQQFIIVNNASTTIFGAMVIASDSTVISPLFPGTTVTLQCVSTSDTSSSGWSYFASITSPSLLVNYANFVITSPQSPIIQFSFNLLTSPFFINGTTYTGILSGVVNTPGAINDISSINFGNVQSTGTVSTLTLNNTSMMGPELLIFSNFTLSSPALVTVSFPKALSSQGSLSITAGLFTTLSLPSLFSITGTVTINYANLITLNLPSLQYFSGLVLTSAPALTTVNMGALIINLGAISGTANALTTLTLTNLTIMSGAFSLTASTLTTLSLPALTTMGSTWSTTMALVTTATFTNLQNVVGAVTASFAALATLTFPAIVSFAAAVTFTAANLVTFSMGATLKSVGGNWTMTGMKLNQASVDGILVSLAALDGTNGTTAYSSKTINLSGGTSSAPSATGLAAKATLVARSCTVTTN